MLLSTSDSKMPNSLFVAFGNPKKVAKGDKHYSLARIARTRRNYNCGR